MGSHGAVGAPDDDDDDDDDDEGEGHLAVLETMLAKKPKGGKLPKRGEKGFAPTGALDETAKLERARQLVYAAMTDVRLANTRTLAMAVWDARRGLAEVTQPRGNMFNAMGRTVRQTIFLLPEETAYLVDRGVLQLTVDGQPASVQQTIATCLGRDYPFAKYQVYCYLKRLGFIVTRHGLPWAAMPTPDEAKTGVMDATRFLLSSKKTTEHQSEEEAMDTDAADQHSPRIEQQPSLFTSAVALFSRTLVGVSGWVRSIFVRQSAPSPPAPAPAPVPADVAAVAPIRPLLDFNDRPTPGRIMASLQIIKTAPPGTATLDAQQLIAFDVYRPNNQFGRTHPPPVAFKIVVAQLTDSPFDLHTIQALFAAADRTPLRVAVVHGGTVTFYQLVDMNLPHHPLHLEPKRRKQTVPQQQLKRQKHRHVTGTELSAHEK